MRDRVFFPLAALLALGMVALALIWPQGMGAAFPSFRHPLTVPAPIVEAPPAPKAVAKPAPAADTARDASK